MTSTLKELKIAEMEAIYVMVHWATCPVCHSYEIEGEEVNIEGNNATQEISCTNCGSSWVDVYSLTGFRGLKLGDNLPSNLEWMKEENGNL